MALRTKLSNMALTFNRHYTHAYVNSLFKLYNSETNSDDPIISEAGAEVEYVWLPMRLPLAEMLTAFEIDDSESGYTGTQVYLNNGHTFFVHESRQELEEAQDTILDKSLFMEEPGYKILSNDSTKG